MRAGSSCIPTRIEHGPADAGSDSGQHTSTGDAEVLADGCVVQECDAQGKEHFNPASCACEPCATSDECTDGKVCLKGTGCVECTAEDASACDVQGKLCSSEGTNTCVECNVSTDCKDAGKPVCGNHQCKPCDSSNDCADNKICITDAGPFQGQCVECTADKLDNCAVDDDGKHDVCNAKTLTCEVGVKEQSGTLCGVKDQKPCVSNRECPEGSVCVQEFLGEQTSDSWYCMPLQSSALLCTQPFAGQETRPTIDGSSADVCSLALSTCTAHAQYRNTPCASDSDPNQGDDSKCGLPGIDDGYCAKGGLALGWRCTVKCNNDIVDCPLAAASCKADSSPNFCSL
jgi:hypothetical protein